MFNTTSQLHWNWGCSILIKITLKFVPAELWHSWLHGGFLRFPCCVTLRFVFALVLLNEKNIKSLRANFASRSRSPPGCLGRPWNTHLWLDSTRQVLCITKFLLFRNTLISLKVAEKAFSHRYMQMMEQYGKGGKNYRS